MKLGIIRKKINKIDKQLTQLLKNRSLLIPKVKRIKKNWAYKIAFNREFSMAEKINQQDFGLYPKTYMQKIWREIISATLYIECQLTIHIYNKNNNYELWELAKDHFGSFSNLVTHSKVEDLLQYLAQGKTEAIILPYPNSQEQWWLHFLNPAYQDIRINLELPYLQGIKTFTKAKGMCLSKNTKDTSALKFFIIKHHKPYNLSPNIELLDQTPKYLFVKTSLLKTELASYFNINDITEVGSTPLPIS
ncbi:chorismate mutase [Candidatus Hepatincola sp. Pdp]